jgi:UDP-N-acetylmuramoylalanine--D-glutamate ligase
LAVASFPEPARIHLIAGGYDKGVSLAPISALGGTLAGLYTIGDTGEMIARDAGDAAESCGTLDRAVHRAIERMNDGDVLLLSPGCASWDQFADFRERGMAFASLVSNC